MEWVLQAGSGQLGYKRGPMATGEAEMGAVGAAGCAMGATGSVLTSHTASARVCRLSLLDSLCLSPRSPSTFPFGPPLPYSFLQFSHCLCLLSLLDSLCLSPLWPSPTNLNLKSPTAPLLRRCCAPANAYVNYGNPQDGKISEIWTGIFVLCCLDVNLTLNLMFPILIDWVIFI
ncbi:hypothetical protein SLEP1_g58620 [Rubroshorea leprosula]|uniref:Uncharacterized protein n=1 Tax=Rubroshorea leprosula TaxID=152421 RepID=A0AAV5MPV9_9ROSI|nr:hypothetical protein SLEP1_g58620 [Rubroshorea leprosula]